MKRLFLLTVSLLIVTALSAQQRGFKPIKVEGTGTTTLYKQSHALNNWHEQLYHRLAKTQWRKKRHTRS